MAHNPLDGFLTKTQASKKFGRHKSTITRGINAALRAKDDKVLDLCKVKTADGKILDGNSMAPELLSQLHNDGLRPIWYLRPEVMDLMIKRDSSPHESSNEAEPDGLPPTLDEGTRPATNLPDATSADYVTELEKQLAVTQERLFLVEEQNRQLVDDKEYFKEQAKVVTELQKEDNIVRGQTNELMKELLDRLRASDKKALSTPAISKGPPHDVSDAEVIQIAKTNSDDKPPRKRRTKSSSRPKPKNSRSKKATPTRANAIEKHLPTLSKIFRRSS